MRRRPVVGLRGEQFKKDYISQQGRKLSIRAMREKLPPLKAKLRLCSCPGGERSIIRNRLIRTQTIWRSGRCVNICPPAVGKRS